mgnify:FL=1
MSWFHDLGKKVSSAAHRLGHKVTHAVHQGVKGVVKHSEDISRIAGKVGKVAGIVGKVASAALPFTAEIPILGEVVGAAAAGGKAIEKVSAAVQKGANLITAGKNTFKHY